MPTSALMVLTSPMLLAHGSPESLSPIEVPPARMIAEAGAARLPRSLPQPQSGLLAVSWSLADVQQEEGPPSDPESEEESGAEQSTEGEGIVVTGTYGPPEGDPMARVNEESYRITQQLDDVFVEPIAYAYRDGLPGPIRDGLGNVVRNLGEPKNALNFLLQGKFGKALGSLTRLLINSTLGFGGLVDMAAKPGIGIPYRRNGFGNTMGFYGIGTGPYLYLPVVGATSVRDVIGSGLDQLVLPLGVGRPFNQTEFNVPYFLIGNLDVRLQYDAEMERIGETLNPYAARRDSYLYRREVEIAELRGVPPPERPMIMDEVEGTGDFAEPPPEPDTSGESKDGSEPLAAVIITQPR